MSQKRQFNNTLTNRLNSFLEEFKLICEKYGGVSHEKTKNLAKEFMNDWDAIFRILQYPYLSINQ
jgi:transposase